MTMQTVLRVLLEASRRGSIVLVAATCLSLPWPTLPALMPIAAALLVFAGTLVTHALGSLRQRDITVAADDALDAGSLLVSAVEIEQHPGRHDSAAGSFTMQRARTALPDWRAAIPGVLRLPSARAFLIPLAFLLAGSALLALRPDSATSTPKNPLADDVDERVSGQVIALRESLRLPEPDVTTRSAVADAPVTGTGPKPVGGGQDRPVPAAEASLTEKRNTGDRSDAGPTQKTGVSGTGSRAGFVAGADVTGRPARVDVELNVVDAEIERSGAIVAGTEVSNPAGFARSSTLAPASAGTAMPAASLATGATDFELTPAERGYYERYRRHREAKP
jgi:hypothetical protein